MGKIFDITQKLKYAEPPVLKLGEREMKINNSAERVLRFIEESRDITNDPSALKQTAMLLFSEEDWDYLMNDLQLDMPDFSKVLNAAVALAQGNEPNLDSEDESGF